MDELIEKLRKAVLYFDKRREEAPTSLEKIQLRSKTEGLQLALHWAEEEQVVSAAVASAEQRS